MSVLSLDELRQELVGVVSERRAFVEKCKRDLKAAQVELKGAERLLKRWKSTAALSAQAPRPASSLPTPRPVAPGAPEPLSASELEIRAKVLATLKREGALPPHLLWPEVGGNINVIHRRRVIAALVAERLIEERGNTTSKRIALVKA